MSRWWTYARTIAARGEAAVLVTVCSVQGSAPREAGAKMLVWADGQEGTVGGGNLEFTIVDQARKMLGVGGAHRFQSYPLGPLLGQCCGGCVGILLERIDGASAGWLAAIEVAEAAGRPYAIQSMLDDGRVAKQVIDRNGVTDLQGAEAPVLLIGRDGQIAVPAERFDAKGLCIVERVDPRPLLLMFGAGHVGKALAPILATLPLRTRWFDTRLEFGAPDGPLQPAIVADLVAEAQAAPAGALYLVFTQSHALDYDLTRAILARDDFRYCGLIGSRTKRARFEKRLVADGIARALLSRLTCPIGAIGLISKEPQVLAIAIAAELLLTVQSRAAAQQPKAIHGR
ncbi:MAG TPA: xanthine dehydrogenase accessory protein XdhC [Rhizomicrobium sp.]|jgi:xanthine dehydrogenase accessory factor|nr:xanthine dehydrogenase accessory protein XdhC [Rhizomicrobium sp.]